MIRFKVTEDGKWLELVSDVSDNTLKALNRFFSKKSKGAEFDIRVKRKLWDGMDRFFDGKRISIGLWKELYNFASLYGVECEIINIKDYLNLDFDRDIFIAFLDNLFENVTNDKGDPIYPRNYQIEGAYRALKYKFCNEELATSAGKTLIFYSYLSYLKHTGVINKNNKALLVVPNVSLVNQTVKGFDEYTNGYVKFNIMKIGGSHSFNEEEFENADLVISTYQSLIEMEPYSLKARFLELKKRRVGKKKKAEKEQKMKKLLEKITSSVNKGYFKKFSVVCIDETHKARSGSIQNIIKSCSNAEYKLGLSGTTKISEQYSDYYNIQVRTGPLVMILDAKYLQDNDYSPNVNINIVYMEYDDNNEKVKMYKEMNDKEYREAIKKKYKDKKKFGLAMLDFEKSIIYESKDRLNFISKLTKKIGKNTLILYSDIKNGYGKAICEEIKKWNKRTYYIDGGTEEENRQKYKDILESNDDVVLVASYGTFSTGIDTKNLHHIIFAESVKSEITIRQSIGRGMRSHHSKDKIVIWDLVDDLNGYSNKHSLVREEIYNKQQFKTFKHRLKIYRS